MDAAAVDHEKEGNLPFFSALQREIGDVEAGGNDLRDPFHLSVHSQRCPVAAGRQVAKRDEPGVFLRVVKLGQTFQIPVPTFRDVDCHRVVGACLFRVDEQAGEIAPDILVNVAGMAPDMIFGSLDTEIETQAPAAFPFMAGRAKGIEAHHGTQRNVGGLRGRQPEQPEQAEQQKRPRHFASVIRFTK